MSSFTARYEPIGGDEKGHASSDDGIEDYKRLLDAQTTQKRRAFYQKHWRLLLEVLLLLCSLAALTATVLYEGPLEWQQKKCGRLLGQWLPDAEEGVEYEVRHFHSPFQRQLPLDHADPEVDALWENTTAPGGFIGITKEEWEAVNDYHEYPVLLDEDYGTGQYMAMLEVFHQLHCLNLLRQSLHRNSYEDPFESTPPNLMEGHLEHCVEMLRQMIMCKGDMSLMTYNWVDAEPVPYPNSNTVHTCKKWDSLARWNIDRATDGGRREMQKRPEKPKGVKAMSFPP